MQKGTRSVEQKHCVPGESNRRYINGAGMLFWFKHGAGMILVDVISANAQRWRCGRDSNRLCTLIIKRGGVIRVSVYIYTHTHTHIVWNTTVKKTRVFERVSYNLIICSCGLRNWPLKTTTCRHYLSWLCREQQQQQHNNTHNITVRNLYMRTVNVPVYTCTYTIILCQLYMCVSVC